MHLHSKHRGELLVVVVFNFARWYELGLCKLTHSSTALIRALVLSLCT